MRNEAKYSTTFSENLRRILDERGMMQSELAEKVHVSRATVTYWMQGSVPMGERMDRLCDVLKVTAADLLLDDSVLTRRYGTEHREIPLYGEISAGYGFFAENNILRYVSVDKSVRGDFGVIVAGDSMVGAGINNGDIALFLKQFQFHEGNIYAVWQYGEDLSYLKHVYINGNKYVLTSDNPNYAPIVIENNEARILGELTGIYRSIEQ